MLDDLSFLQALLFTVVVFGGYLSLWVAIYRAFFLTEGGDA